MPVLEQPRTAPVPPSRADELLLIDLDGAATPGEKTKTPLLQRRGVVIGAALLLVLTILYASTIFFRALT